VGEEGKGSWWPDYRKGGQDAGWGKKKGRSTRQPRPPARYEESRKKKEEVLVGVFPTLVRSKTNLDRQEKEKKRKTDCE